jgi:hypothetical protein
VSLPLLLLAVVLLLLLLLAVVHSSLRPCWRLAVRWAAAEPPGLLGGNAGAARQAGQLV